jgi:hypothetical protein
MQCFVFGCGFVCQCVEQERVQTLKRDIRRQNGKIKDLETTITEEAPDVSWSLLMDERGKEIEIRNGCEKEIDERSADLQNIPSVDEKMDEIVERLGVVQKEKDAILEKMQKQENVTRRFAAEKRATQKIVAQLEDDERKKIIQTKRTESERMQLRRLREEELEAEEFWDRDVVFDSVRAVEEELGNLEKRRMDLSTSYAIHKWFLSCNFIVCMYAFIHRPPPLHTIQFVCMYMYICICICICICMRVCVHVG